MSLTVLLGEQNTYYNRDKYTCTFSKMIESWRSVWLLRTGFITDPIFPFGFVQVRGCLLSSFNPSFLSFFRYRHSKQQVRLLEDFHGFAGIKHSILAMYLMMLYQMSSWQSLAICEMIQTCKNMCLQ
jgi:hypothetical protein